VKQLGDLERAVMEVVWSATAPMSVRDVLAGLAGRRPAYTTVMTVLDRLAHKSVVTRELAGRAWAYSATLTREEFVARLMLDVLQHADSRDAALAHFARVVTPDEARTLREALDGLWEGEPGQAERRVGGPPFTGGLGQGHRV
jgi:predicted transcriptional regulator